MDKTLLENAHDIAKDLFDTGAIDLITLREFDANCLPKVEDMTPAKIKSIREKERVSQSVFARLLNTSCSTVRQWERGEKHPRGTSLKLLSIVSKNGLGVLMA